MKKKSIYLLSAIVIALFVAGGGPYHEAFANGLTLTSPNGGEVISGGSTYQIEWVAPPEMARFKLIYSMNEGKAWKPIKSGIIATGYDWTVPKPKNNKPRCLVKVIGYDNTGIKVGADRSDAPFTILGKMASLEVRVAALEEVLAYVSIHTGTINGVVGPHVIFTGVNVHVRSGSGYTSDLSDLTGLGNLIIGYNEAPSGLGAGERGGSHNLVIGRNHRYSSYGGLVLGHGNTISGVYAVSVGYQNTASGTYSIVSGGDQNTASGDAASISGGRKNEASGYLAGVSGGYGNTASGSLSSVSGGFNNEASDNNSTVSGGYENMASGIYSSVSGGYGNEASGDYSTVSGGYENMASGSSASVSGGYSNEASGVRATVSGGQSNTASTHYSSVSGGFSNTASGNYSSVSGGLNRTATGDYDWAAGGLWQDE